MIFEESVTETQTVRFILDKTKSFDELTLNILTKQPGKVIVFCDEALRNTWLPALQKKLHNFFPLEGIIFLKAEEASKDLRSFAFLVDHLAHLKCSRDDLIVALGGGTILDAISFLASVYMRGIPLMMIPTTLIGQADAATAGKTCINTEYSKNLLGTLYLPRVVYNNVTLLHTNSPYQMRQGFSEVFKYGLLGSHRLLDLLMAYKEVPSDDVMIEIVRETINVRIKIRRQDPLASNLGHTFGHALEKYSHYEVSHGDAIAAGIMMALTFSVEQSIISSELKDYVVILMNRLALNRRVQQGIDAEAITALMRGDKKSSSEKIGLVLIKDIALPYNNNGSPFYMVEPDRVKNFLTRFFDTHDNIWIDHWNKLKQDV